ncbi:MAG: RCC1 domain-containing protein [Polyangiales bacterium]
MVHESRRAGAGPYREARLTPPARASAPAVATGIGGAVAAVATVARLLFERSAPAEAPSRYIERATSLAGGVRVMAVFADRDARHPEVLRVPGEPRRRGSDTVVTPDVLAGNGAVAALPDGEHLRDARGELLRVQGGVVQPLPGAELAPVAELRDPRRDERAGDFLRLASGGVYRVRGVPAAWTTTPDTRLAATALATDGATVCAAFAHGVVDCADKARWDSFGGSNAPFVGWRLHWIRALEAVPARVEQLAVSGRVVCARTTGGAVTCARRERGPGDRYMPASFETGPRATSIALGNDDLCLLAPDHRLHCVHGPREDAAAALDATPLRLRFAMDGVDEVGLADGVGCARRGGRVECWGPLVRNGWVTQRERPVRVEGAEGATALASTGGLVCALANGAVGCWGVGRDGVRRPRWTSVTLPERALALWREPWGFCASFAAAGRWCWDDVGPTAPPPRSMPGAGGLDALELRDAPGVFASSGRLRCVVAASGGVSCRRSPSTDELDPRFSPVAGIDDVLSVVVTDGDLACARRRDGSVWCWGDNRSGVLTAAEAADRPRVVTLSR